MTWYSPYNTYANQFQYYNPYSYSSYYSTPYGMMTDGSYQNHYYTVHGANDGSAVKTGFKIVFEIIKIVVNIASLAGGGGGGIFPSSDSMANY